MGQILSWIRGPRDTPALQDVAVEEQIHGNYRPLPLPRQNFYQSQTSQATPKPAAPASTVKPAQFETSSAGAAMATKPGGVTAATSGAAGKVSVGAAGKETNTTPAGATVIDMSSAGAAVVNMASTGVRGSPKQMSKSVPASGAKTSVSAGAAAGTAAAAAASTAALSKAPTKDAGKSSTPAAALQADPPKASKPAAAGSSVGMSVQGRKEEAKPAKTKLLDEALAPAATASKQAPADDPFSALSSLLPSDAPKPQEPLYTGPEVKERDTTSSEAQKCGEREDTLPPDYRWKNMPPAAADTKPPQDVPKPLSTDQALDCLSAGFDTEKTEPCVTVASAPASNFAPPPGKKSEPPVVVSPAPPADKKAKMDDFSLAAGLAPTPFKKSAAPAAVSASAPADKKGPKPVTDEGASMSLDALNALGDILPKAEPKPEPVEVRPEDIVPEDKLKKEKGVLVGEREDTLPPGYRFNKEELKKLPAPEPEITMGTDEALDLLSGGFNLTSQKAPVAKCPAPPADKKAKTETAVDGFSLEAGLTSSTAKRVEAGVPPVAVCPPASKKGDPMSLDALSALGGTLAKDEPKPEPAKLRPEDIVSEDKHKKEKGVRVGERDDTIAPDYRFNEEELKKLPPPEPELTVSTDDALDILSGGFNSPSTAPAVKTQLTPASAPPAQTKVEDLSALDLLSGELVSSTKSAGVQAPLPPPSKKAPERTVCPLQQPSQPFDVLDTHGKKMSDPLPSDALAALGDTLGAAEPKPESPKLRPEDIVSENKHKKEKGVLVGERDDTIPEDYRFNEEELKKLPAPKPEPTMSTGDALDILSGGFDVPAVCSQPPVVSASAPPVQSSADFALDALGAEFVSSNVAPAVKSAAAPPTASAAAMDAAAGDAMDLLSDTLADIAPRPHQPEPVPLKNIVKEDKVKEERLIKMGERDDSLPPEYRPTEEDLKKMAEAKPAPKEKTMDDKTALDLLSSDFSTKPSAPVSASAATTKLECAAGESEPQKPMAGPVLDSLADTLLPNTPAPKADKQKGKSKSKSKSKKHHAADAPAVDDLSAQLSSDVVPATKRGSKR